MWGCDPRIAGGHHKREPHGHRRGGERDRGDEEISLHYTIRWCSQCTMAHGADLVHSVAVVVACGAKERERACPHAVQHWRRGPRGEAQSVPHHQGPCGAKAAPPCPCPPRRSRSRTPAPRWNRLCCKRPGWTRYRHVHIRVVQDELYDLDQPWTSPPLCTSCVADGFAEP